MLAIKREQREKLGEPAFEDRTAGYLRRNCLGYVYMLSDEELLFRVRHAIAKARSYELTWESSITIFVAHMLTINPEFDKQKVISEVLHDPNLDAGDRMTAMLGVVDDEDWDEAAGQCDADAYWAEVHAKTKAKEG